jgi:hypothetical protein
VILDHAEAVNVTTRRRWERSTIGDNEVVQNHAFEGRTDRVRTYALRWNYADPATVALIEEHFLANMHAPFAYAPPTNGAAFTVDVLYTDAPRVARNGPRSYTVDLQLFESALQT